MIKLCVFDLDGTLVNSLEDLANSTNFALETNGFARRDMDEFRFLVGDGLRVLMHRAMGDAFDEACIPQLLEHFNEHYAEHYDEFTRPYAGCSELLDRLQRRGIQLAVLSNKPDHFTKIIVRQMFPNTVFAQIQGTTDRFPRKPDPASLLHILHDLGIQGDEALYIGDTNTDISTAHNAGVKIAGAAWGFRGKSELMAAGADFIVESPAEIEAVVFR